MQLIIKHFSELSPSELYRIMQARVSVFVVEQNCPYQELDGKDVDALHVWYEEGGEICAYLRVLAEGVSYPGAASVGRVLTLRRGEGLGAKLMQEGVRLARERYGARKIRIGAQLYAKGFYEKAGFVQDSEPYDEDGIPHIEMLLCEKTEQRCTQGGNE
ncbi:MAG: GNAT family N-acetyltransferase [Oscillospiraceae bacterium]